MIRVRGVGACAATQSKHPLLWCELVAVESCAGNASAAKILMAKGRRASGRVGGAGVAADAV
jgi:hypothetical protein